MSTFNNLPNYTRLEYNLNTNTGWYGLTHCSKINFYHLPTELKTEPSNQPFLIKQGAKECIKGRQLHYNKFFTGMRFTHYPNLYTGDNIKDKPSLIFFHFRQERTVLAVYYINGYKVFPKRLKTFVDDFKKNIIDLGI